MSMKEQKKALYNQFTVLLSEKPEMKDEVYTIKEQIDSVYESLIARGFPDEDLSFALESSEDGGANLHFLCNGCHIEDGANYEQFVASQLAAAQAVVDEYEDVVDAEETSDSDEE